MNGGFSREMDSMIDLPHSPINRSINSTINDRVIPKRQSITGSLPLNRNGPEPSTSLTEHGIGNAWKNKNTITEKDSKSACDLRQDTNFTLYRNPKNPFLKLTFFCSYTRLGMSLVRKLN